jgi:hypothetical protein
MRKVEPTRPAPASADFGDFNWGLLDEASYALREAELREKLRRLNDHDRD